MGAAVKDLSVFFFRDYLISIDTRTSMTSVVCENSDYTAKNSSAISMWQNSVLRRVVIVGLIVFLIYYFIFCRPSPQIFLTESDLYTPMKSENVNLTVRRRIPRIIHQTWKTKTPPEKWQRTVRSILEMNSDKFEYRLWTDSDIHEFVSNEDPYFYEQTFVKYPFDIQRIDAVRYFILYRFGGIYIDMDNGCSKPFDSLLAALENLDPNVEHLAAFPRTNPIGISNGFMISTKEHPFFDILKSRLPLFNHNFLIHYLTIMLSTGPSYVSINEFYFNPSVYRSVVRIIEQHVHASIYTWHTIGNSWHQGDGKIIVKVYHALRSHSALVQNTLILLILFLIIIFAYAIGIQGQRKCCFHLRQLRRRSLSRIFHGN